MTRSLPDSLRSRVTRRTALATGLGLGAAALAGCGHGATAEGGEGSFVGSGGGVTIVPIDERKPAPDVSGTTLGGKHLSLSQFTGQVVVLNVWGSWCPPCRKEAPDLAKASRATKDIAQFVGITVKDYDPAPAKAFVRSFDIPYPSLYDPDGAQLVKFQGILPATGIPCTLIIDPKGRAAVRILSTISEHSLVQMIKDISAGKTS